MSSNPGQYGKKLLLVVFMSQLLTCTSVSKEEKSETLDRILRVEEEPKVVASLETPTEEEDSKPDPQSAPETTEPTATPIPEPQPTPLPTPVVEASPQPTPTPQATPPAEPSPTAMPAARPTSPSGISQRPAPNLKQPQKLDLPLPRGVVHADLFHFLNVHADMIVAYQPLIEEWNLYAKAFSSGNRAGEDEIAGLRARVRENLARAHWLFVWGVFQASNSLLSPQKNMQLIVDRQTDFIERMNVLVFLMIEMQSAGMKTNHRNFLREFYKYINLKHFKRPMRDRPAKPMGTLRP